MTIRNLDRLLAPRSVALIGASRKGTSVGLITARNLLRGGFEGPIWLVNPKYRDIEGHPCYPSIAALPAAPQLAVVATPPHTVPGLIACWPRIRRCCACAANLASASSRNPEMQRCGVSCYD